MVPQAAIFAENKTKTQNFPRIRGRVVWDR